MNTVTSVLSSARGALTSFYYQNERIAWPLFFLGGVTYDGLTLSRIDRLFDNVILLSYLVVLGALIVLIGRLKQGRVSNQWFKDWKDWYPFVIQFLLGGLFSAYAIYYFQSTPLSSSALFFCFLILLMVANEFLDDHLMNLRLIVSLYLFVTFSFFVYFIPVILGAMGPLIFYTSAFISLLPVVLVVYLIYRRRFQERFWEVGGMGVLLTAIFVGILGAYHWNVIPPVPLAMEKGGIYHNVDREGDVYKLKYQSPPWYHFWADSNQTYYYKKGDKVYCFVAVFAPAQLKETVKHEWQLYDPKDEKWVTTDVIDYPIYGGRAEGYRGYSYKGNVQTGT
ncbi:MAG: DUF2914 domain-containing protein [bacterium]